LLDLASDCDGLYVEGTDQWAARVLARRGLVEITEETEDGWIMLRITPLGCKALDEEASS
jgi:hypothetical protein